MAVDGFRDKFWQNQNIEWWYRQNVLLYVKRPADAETAPLPNHLIHPKLLTKKLKRIQVLNDKLEEIFQGRRTTSFYFGLLLKALKVRVLAVFRR